MLLFTCKTPLRLWHCGQKMLLIHITMAANKITHCHWEGICDCVRLNLLWTLLGYLSIRNNGRTSGTGGQIVKCQGHWCETAKDLSARHPETLNRTSSAWKNRVQLHKGDITDLDHLGVNFLEKIFTHRPSFIPSEWAVVLFFSCNGMSDSLSVTYLPPQPRVLLDPSLRLLVGSLGSVRTCQEVCFPASSSYLWPQWGSSGGKHCIYETNKKKILEILQRFFIPVMTLLKIFPSVSSRSLWL